LAAGGSPTRSIASARSFACSRSRRAEELTDEYEQEGRRPPRSEAIDEAVEHQLRQAAPKLAITREGKGEPSDIVALRREDYDRLVDEGEDREASAAYDRTRGQETVPHDVVDRIFVKRESPIRVWREHRGMTLDQLSDATGKAKGYLSEIESGKKTGTLDTLKAIAAALRVDLEDIAGWPARTAHQPAPPCAPAPRRADDRADRQRWSGIGRCRSAAAAQRERKQPRRPIGPQAAPNGAVFVSGDHRNCARLDRRPGLPAPALQGRPRPVRASDRERLTCGASRRWMRMRHN
jgi:transcriptional regulator with XRE-family HTH domain